MSYTYKVKYINVYYYMDNSFIKKSI
ncbi:hypothetical protein PFFVO_04279 [Plasmodium falciparum Vietnam Oak-Knoll (FVO)]|uniref:Uncharacterized protein n=1 Tax=Plasmodium falciparum Vietnam Oak-Knoll (FVO) TaxID=1036723 RepID=A0A024V1E3_PLAFA|nr:hypothetical protein PFFVO_04279 [Plasmodium falciparum Vietnam Oak-Knoll (FVO)]